MSSRTVAQNGNDYNPDPPYAGDKGFRRQHPAELTRLLLVYEALAADEDTPPPLRAYSAAAIVELRLALEWAVAA